MPVGCDASVDPLEPRRALLPINRRAPAAVRRVDSLNDGDQCRNARRRAEVMPSIGPSSADRRASCAKLGTTSTAARSADQEVRRPPPAPPGRRYQ